MNGHVIEIGEIDVLIMGKFLPLRNLPYSQQNKIVIELTRIIGINLEKRYGGRFSFEIISIESGCIKGKIKITWVLIASLASAICAYPSLKEGAKELWNDASPVIEFVANGQKCEARFSDENFIDGLYGPIKKGETLGEIADKIICINHTKEQIMVAIFNSNQDAFINSNINLIKAGKVITIPQHREIERVSAVDAKNTVAVHDKKFYNKRH